MLVQPSNTLKSRTFVGLILSQFLAAFNDQAIHASAMFYAINEGVLTESQAISLMPILFYAPWAIFCTLAGYLSDRFSKRSTLVFWKMAEVVITLVALAGFWLGSGTEPGNPAGPWIVLATVFLMGTHSAFFVPAKYGVMPEILQPQQLSKGNGVLESTSFLAVILGTVTGGILSSPMLFRNREYVIGLILVCLALMGAVFSLLIRPTPAANPTRPFPWNPVKPLLNNLRTLTLSRPLALSVLGIAFFTFMVAFMRSTMYMHGESQNPRWDEFQTSLVVATVALGVGLGSPLAGFLSGGKVELGLVPLGAVGMIVGCLGAAAAISYLPGLVVGLVLIGFFSGFYIVPLYTLLQHRAPKTSKGDLVATSNFINVTGAIAASLLFFSLVFVARLTGIAQPVGTPQVYAGQLTELERQAGHPRLFKVESPAEAPLLVVAHSVDTGDLGPRITLHVDDDAERGSEVVVRRYEIRGVVHYDVWLKGKPEREVYDQIQVPRYLFIGASLMTLGILILLCRQVPDFFVRTLLWLRSQGRYRVKVFGMNNLPSEGPVLLATNCDRFEACMQVAAATDRYTRFVLFESPSSSSPRRPLLRYLARRTGLIALRPDKMTPDERLRALAKAARTLDAGYLLGLALDNGSQEAREDFIQELDRLRPMTVVPVYCGASRPSPSTNGRPAAVGRVRVVIGQPLPAGTTALAARQSIQALADWVKQSEADETSEAVAQPVV